MMKRRRIISDGELSDPDEGRSPVKIKVELEGGEQEAQGPDTTMMEEGQKETSDKPLPKIPEDPSATMEVLAEKEPEEGKL